MVKKIVIVAVLLAMFGTGWLLRGLVSSSPETGPPRPAWVRPNGSVDLSTFPAWIEVLKGDGTDAVWGWMQRADASDPGQGPIPIYDQPAGRVIGQMELATASGASSH